MDTVEEKIVAAIEEHREEILAFARDILKHPELGYKEHRTAEQFSKLLQKHGIPHESGLAVTGVKGRIRGGAEKGPAVALIGELDAVKCPGHPFADPVTGASHSCGHNAQLAGVAGAAIALSLPGVREHLAGDVIPFAVPAEEYGEIEFKNQLKEQSVIRYGGGKSELLRIGAFDDVDVCVAHHTRPGLPGVSVGNTSSNGFVSKLIRYKGREAHAAASPERGINALYAATVGLTALNAVRETFRDEDSVRVHPILTSGGNLVNVIPNTAVIETLVRGKNIEAIEDAGFKTDRAFQAGALALGAAVEITTLPGYLPVIPFARNEALFRAARAVLPPEKISEPGKDEHGAGSTDVGDLTHVLPVLVFNTGGVAGHPHSSDFTVTDEDAAYLLTAKIMALSAYQLLKDGAAEAEKVKEAFDPRFTREAYIEYMNHFESVRTIDYRKAETEEGTVE